MIVYAFFMLTDKRRAKIEEMVERRQSGIVVVLEDVHDPHNAAAVLRSCDAFGVQDVYFVFDKQAAYNPRRVGKASSSSANKWLSYKKFSSASECLQELKGEGFEIVGTALNERSEDLFEMEVQGEKVALVFGNEHAGLSERAVEMCDRLLEIPMRGMVQSLNISVAAALCVYEVTRQRGKDEKYLLNDGEKGKLMNKFCDRGV